MGEGGLGGECGGGGGGNVCVCVKSVSILFCSQQGEIRPRN